MKPKAEEDAYVMAVADGMGGGAFGEMASMLAIRTGVDLTLSAVKWTMKINRHEIEELLERLEAYFYQINQVLIEYTRRDPKLAGMGTTLTVAYTIGTEAFIVHAGDSRAYLLHDGELQRLTRDHTIAQLLADAGEIAPEEVASHALGHVLVNCLGDPDSMVGVEINHVQLADGDVLMLCTDGLSKHLDDDQIAEILTRRTDPEAACQSLIDEALERGGRDNVTVVLGRYSVVPSP